EVCLERRWPGNVRELLAEVREAARAAVADGARSVDGKRLAAKAGKSFNATIPPPRAGGMPPREALLAALQKQGGRIATAARALGVHRNQLRRWLARHEIDPRHFADGEK